MTDTGTRDELAGLVDDAAKGIMRHSLAYEAMGEAAWDDTELRSQWRATAAAALTGLVGLVVLRTDAKGLAQAIYDLHPGPSTRDDPELLQRRLNESIRAAGWVRPDESETEAAYWAQRTAELSERVSELESQAAALRED